MRGVTHDVKANFMVNGALLQRARATAGRRGMSLSEFMRAAVRSEIERAQ
ncbi:hypothetical protein [Sphingomonas sanxanigenens]|uniref:Ribbon-helix-helix protein CopG domain-containing protein n=1 Tax=Sphingomonas sanxanigenens DSM 19645 = NX02 TaxID=1123269 RepID=W0A8Z8_9SPHN|nr:hypothetical protein [Sphingomonas sanxanigenens]AHE52818.1 hypothetical protein NX02_05395 [Sphingomonas sanxanigenens DSM 19645 = NX02]